MDLEGIMLSEISQRKMNTVWYHLYVESKKFFKSEYNKKDRYREQTSGHSGLEGAGGLVVEVVRK